VVGFAPIVGRDAAVGEVTFPRRDHARRQRCADGGTDFEPIDRGQAETAIAIASFYEGWAFDGTAFTRTFDVIGGTATIRIVNQKVELVSAAPKNGYTYSVLPQDTPQRLVVRFDRPGGPASIIDAMWWLERPYAEVSEVK
jgi:hypothetical protein